MKVDPVNPISKVKASNPKLRQYVISVVYDIQGLQPTRDRSIWAIRDKAIIDNNIKAVEEIRKCLQEHNISENEFEFVEQSKALPYSLIFIDCTPRIIGVIKQVPGVEDIEDVTDWNIVPIPLNISYPS